MSPGGDFLAKNTWGDPTVAIRMPKPVIRAAKRLAFDEKMTLSSLVRELLTKKLLEEGYAISDNDQLDGQITFADDE